MRDAQAQTVYCPTGSPQDPTFYATGNWCATLQLIWPGPCGCADSTYFYMPCTPAGHGGAIHGGAIGCDVYCAYPESDSLCRVDVEVLGTPPRQPEPAPPQACTSAGLPVSVTTGEMFFTHADADVGELALTRTYNSARVSAGWRHGRFGPGWNASFERRLRVLSPRQLELRLDDGTPLYYLDVDGDGTFTQDIPRWSDATIATVPGGYERRLRAGERETYDTQGRLLMARDAAGIATSYAYDMQGRLTSVTRRGRALSLAYDGTTTRPARLLGPDGVLLTMYGYDPAGRLAVVDYPDGSGSRYAYDTAGRILRVTDAAGRPVETHTYDAQGRALTSEIGDGRELLTFQYGANQTTVTDALGSATTYDWSLAQHVPRVTKVTGPCASCGPAAETRQWTYTPSGRVATYLQGTRAWSYSYDDAGNLATETDPLGRITHYAYDSQGRVTSVQQPGGGSTQTTHGPAGPLTVTEALTATTSRTLAMSYEAGLPQTLTDARGQVTTFTYNATGDLVSATDPLGHATTFTYDALGRQTSATDALGHTTTTAYDARGRVTRVTQADGTFSSFTYDSSGRRIAVLDAMGRRTRHVYDAWGRLVQVVDALEQATTYAYDLMGRLTSLTDAKGQTTRFEYDAAGRLAQTIDPGGYADLFSYDGEGRLRTKADRKGVVTTYAYDLLGRLIGKSYSDGTPAVSYSYDQAGRLQSAANGTDTLTWTYDLAGQLLSEQSSRNASLVAYTYDAAGNRLSVSLDGVLFLGYAYDVASRLTKITRARGQVFGFGYDEADRRTSLSYPNGVQTSYSYDSVNRLLRLTAVKASSGTAITDFRYTYDAAGNRVSKTQLDYAETYGYDDVYRLTAVDRTGAAAGPVLWRYGYDAVGNRLTAQVDGTLTTSTYNERNHLLGATAPGAAPVTYGYDVNGNLTSKVEDGHTWAYEWNAEGQLVRVTKDGAEVARYGYDPLGRRVERAVGGVVTGYTYDSEDILREARAGATRRWVHGPGIDEALAAEDGVGQLACEHADGLGSALARTDGAGIATTRRGYDAFGQLQSDTTIAGYAFTGREWDPETGLYYYRARYYDAKTGRFAGEDPLGFDGGDNFYAYVKGNPVRWADPYGLQVLPPGYWDFVIAYAIVQHIRQDVRQWPNPHADTDTSNRIRHCIVSCRISREAPGGKATAYVAGDVFQDPVFVPASIGAHMPQNWNLHSDPGDRRANAIGRCAATSEPGKSCEDACLGHYPEMYLPGEDPRFSGRR
jgi:RHS repeat-associated protein